MSRSPYSAGGISCRSGSKLKRSKEIVPVSKEESQAIDRALLSRANPGTGVKHFAHFDRWTDTQTQLSPELALSEATITLGKIQFAQWRGIRPQLARLLTLIAQAAKADGYSLRVVAETAIQLSPAKPKHPPQP